MLNVRRATCHVLSVRRGVFERQAVIYGRRSEFVIDVAVLF